MNYKIYILFIVSMFAVSFSPVIARYLNHIDPVAISFWRMLIASIIMIIYDFYKTKSKILIINYQYITAGFLLGIHFCLFYASINIMPNNIANATVFGTMAPLFALFIEFYFGRKINRKLILGLFIVLTGSFIMFIYDFSFDNNLFHGNILAILCSICFAIVFILSEKIRQKESAVTFSKNVFVYATISIYIISVAMQVDIFSINKSDIIFLVLLGLIPTIIGHSVLYYLVKFMRPTIVASIPLGEPFIASIAAWFLFPGQVMNMYILIGGITTIFGLYIIINNKK
tara:strand:+ start:663 stop:1520 length:858 start_codon:yes stop_codon:yes gene_type:complete